MLQHQGVGQVEAQLLPLVLHTAKEQRRWVARQGGGGAGVPLGGGSPTLDSSVKKAPQSVRSES